MTTMGDISRVRIATADDVGELLHLCKHLHEENFLFPMSDHKVLDMLVNATRPEIELRRGIIGCIGEPGYVQASIFLEINALWYSEDLGLIELFSYVKPEFRASNNSRDLIAWAMAMSNHFRLPLMIGVISNHRTVAKVRHYKRALGEPAGAFFIHNATTGMGVH